MKFEKKMVYTRLANKERVKTLLDQSFSNQNSQYSIKIVGNANHADDRLGERPLSLRQSIILNQIRKNDGVFQFNQCQISEIRFIVAETGIKIVVSLVINDVVMAVHPLNLGVPSPIQNFGLTEGCGFALIKTVLERPNVPSKFPEINGFKVVKDF